LGFIKLVPDPTLTQKEDVAILDDVSMEDRKHQWKDRLSIARVKPQPLTKVLTIQQF
jgi:hypothetical protein